MLRDLDRRGAAPEVSAAMASAMEAPVPHVDHLSDRRAATVRFGLLAAGWVILLLSGGAFWWSRGLHTSTPNAAALASNPATVVYPPAPPPAVTLASNAPALAAKATPAPLPTHALADVPPPPAHVSPRQKADQNTEHGAPGSARMPLLASLADREHANAATEAQSASGVIPHVNNASDEAAELARAYELAGRGRNSEAIEILRRTVHSWPAHAEGRMALATLLGETAQLDEQLQVLLEGAAQDPRHFSLVAARMQVQRGAAAAALETLERLPVEQRDAEFHAFTAAIAQRAEQHERAAREYRLALAMEPARALWWVGLGASLEQLQQPADALAAYRQAQSVGGASAASAQFVTRRLMALGNTPPERAQAAATSDTAIAAGR
jgi:MSHA biogenesis protein MshN